MSETRSTAPPSIAPSCVSLAPKLPTKKRGKIGYIISLEMSAKNETQLRTQTDRGNGLGLGSVSLRVEGDEDFIHVYWLRLSMASAFAHASTWGWCSGYFVAWATPFGPRIRSPRCSAR